MTLPLLNEVDDGQTELPPSTPAGVGATLKALREARGVPATDAAARLKFSQRQLDALETEQWDRLPAGVSLRGFVKNYARFLGADVDAVLDMLDAQLGPAGGKYVPVGNGYDRDASARNSPRSAAERASTELPLHDEAVHRPWGWLVIILILLFVAGFYAIERNWVPDSWLVFDWLKSLKT